MSCAGSSRLKALSRAELWASKTSEDMGSKLSSSSSSFLVGAVENGRFGCGDSMMACLLSVVKDGGGGEGGREDGGDEDGDTLEDVSVVEAALLKVS